MTLQMPNAEPAGATGVASADSAPPAASLIGLPPSAPLPTNAATIAAATPRTVRTGSTHPVVRPEPGPEVESVLMAVTSCLQPTKPVPEATPITTCCRTRPLQRRRECRVQREQRRAKRERRRVCNRIVGIQTVVSEIPPRFWRVPLDGCVQKRGGSRPRECRTDANGSGRDRIGEAVPVRGGRGGERLHEVLTERHRAAEAAHLRDRADRVRRALQENPRVIEAARENPPGGARARGLAERPDEVAPAHARPLREIV